MLPLEDVSKQTAEIVAAFVSHNSVRSEDLPGIIAAVARAVAGIDGVVSAAAVAAIPAPPVAPPTPAVSKAKSITPDYLICLDDGKRFKSLKRHLAQLGMTPEQYRAKWALPFDYPMVAPNYSAVRSLLAKSNNLGKGAHERGGARPT